MSFKFSKAIRKNVPLLIGIAGPSGSGKTYSAMTLAKGLAGGEKFCVIDTEAGRALHYADKFSFDHGPLDAPFKPLRYLEAIKAADQAGYPVIVVDSMSHEHAGEGGLLDYHEEELARMAGNDYAKRERVKMAAWIKPKTEHKRMMQLLLQIKAHLVLCFRADEKVEIVRGTNGRTEIVPKKTAAGFSGWLPICEKSMPYELTCSMIVLPDRPGVPVPIKIQEQHRPFFPIDRPITEDAGRTLGEWARGGSSEPAAKQTDQPTTAQKVATAFASKGIAIEVIESHLGHAIDTSNDQEFDDLRDIYDRIKSGQLNPSEAFAGRSQDDSGWDGASQ